MEILRDAQNHMTHDANVLGTMVKQLFSPEKNAFVSMDITPGDMNVFVSISIS